MPAASFWSRALSPESSASSFWRRLDRSSTAGRRSSDSQRASRRRVASSPRARATSARAVSRASSCRRPGRTGRPALAGGLGPGEAVGQAGGGGLGVEVLADGELGGDPVGQGPDVGLETAGVLGDRPELEAVGLGPVEPVEQVGREVEDGVRLGGEGGGVEADPGHGGGPAGLPVGPGGLGRQGDPLAGGAVEPVGVEFVLEPFAGLRLPGDGLGNLLARSIRSARVPRAGRRARPGAEGVGQLAEVAGGLGFEAGDGPGLLDDRAGQGGDLGGPPGPGEHLARGPRVGDPDRPPERRPSALEVNEPGQDRFEPAAEFVQGRGQPGALGEQAGVVADPTGLAAEPVAAASSASRTRRS